jgi:NitT/TauT family transport system ATP-binding protein
MAMTNLAGRVRAATSKSRSGSSARTSANQGAIAIRGLEVSYTTKSRRQVKAVGPVDLDIAPGEFLCVLGPSGCGKSTMLMSIAGLVARTAGDVLLDGELILGPRPHEIGVVFQESNLFPWRDALANVALPLEVAAVGKQERNARASEMLDLVGLGAYKKFYPRELSGGMRQRVAIARALVSRPKVLLMDEPFGALDEQLREEMGVQLTNIWGEIACTTIFVTHSIGEAVFLGDRVVTLANQPGCVVDDVRVEFTRPRDPELQETTPFLDVRRRLRRAMTTTSP